MENVWDTSLWEDQFDGLLGIFPSQIKQILGSTDILRYSLYLGENRDMAIKISERIRLERLVRV